MKRNSWHIAAAPILLIIVFTALFAGFSLFNASAQDIDEQGDAEITADSTVGAMEGAKDVSAGEGELAPVEVTVEKLSENRAFTLDLLGTIEAAGQISVYPMTSGQVGAVNVKEGEFVNKGDVMFVLVGANETEHPALKQYQIAAANYEAAGKAYNNTVNAMGAAVASAELQLQSARHQAEGSYIDLQSMAMSIENAQDGVGLARNSLSETRLKNERDLYNMAEKIDDMEDTISDFRQTRSDTLTELMDKINEATDEATRQQLEATLEQTRKGLDAQKKELDSALNELENGYGMLSSAAILTENQLIAQLQQAQNQTHQLYMTKDSTQWKLGLFDGSSDPVQMAEQGVNSARAQADTAVAQAEAALKIAAINLDLASDQMGYLLVKAPVTGTVGTVNAKVGSIATSQAPLTQVISEGDYFLKVGVDGVNAQKINMDSTEAEVMIGGRYVPVQIDTVAPIADPVSKLVNVTVRLPQIALRANQTLPVRFKITPQQDTGAQTLFAPLDAIIIGTENQFLYVLDGDRAKKVDVKLGNINGAVVEILDGLTGDETIIVGGARDLTPGRKVIVK